MTDCDKCKEYNKEKNYCPVFCNVINDTLADKVIEELEKLKGEIRNKRIIDPDFDFDTAGWCIDLIERNIKELKKDNKQS